MQATLMPQDEVWVEVPLEEPIEETEVSYRLGDTDINVIGADFLDAIPDYWGSLDGILVPKKSLHEEGLVRNVKLFITKKGIHFEGDFDEAFRILNENNSYVPSQIIFDEAGTIPFRLSLPNAKRYAIEYIRRGFRGNLNAYRDRYGPKKDLARFQLRLHQTPQGSYVKFSYDPDNLSTLEDVFPFATKVGLYQLEKIVTDTI